jgi:hypothetical protein
MDNQIIENIRSIIGGEQIEFAVESQKSDEVKKIPGYFVSGTVLIVISLFVFFYVVNPILYGEDLEIIFNDEPALISMNDPQSLIIPILFAAVPLIWGLLSIAKGIRILNKKGSCFIITQSKFIHLSDGVPETFAWEDFNGDITTKGDAGNGSVMLFLKRRARLSSQSKFSTSDYIFMAGVPDALSIEKFCQEKINKANSAPQKETNLHD